MRAFIYSSKCKVLLLSLLFLPVTTLTVPDLTLPLAAQTREHRDEDASAESFNRELQNLVRSHPRTKAEAERLAAAVSRSRYRNWYYPDPMIGYMWMDAPYKKDPADLSPRAFMQTELMISQAVPTPGRLSVESDLADLDARRARLRLILTANDLVASYLRDLTRAWKSLHHRDLTRVYLNRFQPILSISGAQYAVGKGGLADLAMARLSARNLEERQTRFAKLYLSSVAALHYYGLSENSLTDRFTDHATADASGRLNIIEGYANLVLASARSGSESSAEQSPEVALFALDAEVASKKKTLAQFEYAPDFTFFAKYYRSGPGNRPEFGTPLPDNQLNLGLTVRVPLWSALNNHNNVDDASHAMEAADLDRGNLVRAVTTTRRTLLFDIEGEEERIQLYRARLIPEAERAVLSAREGYQAGRGDFNSLLRMWDSLYALEMEAVELQADRLEKIFELGRLLNVIQPPVSDGTNRESVSEGARENQK